MEIVTKRMTRYLVPQGCNLSTVSWLIITGGDGVENLGVREDYWE